MFTLKDFKDLSINLSEEYDDAINDGIIQFNTTLTITSNHYTNAALISVLIKKGVITEEELNEEFNNVCTTFNEQIKVLQDVKDQLLQVIELAKNEKEELMQMYADLAERTESQSNISEITE